jgi:hypothetical protein
MRVVCRGACALGYVLFAAIPLVPFVHRWLHPPTEVRVEPGLVGLAHFTLDVLGRIGDGIVVLLWMGGLAAASALASLTAVVLAWVGMQPVHVRWICGLPALLLLGGLLLFWWI